MSSSLGLDPNDPLPHVDDDSELVGENDKLGKPDPGEGSGQPDPRARAAAMPVVGGVVLPIPDTVDVDVADDEADDEQ